MVNKQKLEGLIAAPFTPMTADGALNLAAVEPYADLLAASGVKGVFICGTTGESASLTTDERRAVAEAWVAAAAGRLKVIVHVGSNCAADAIALAQHAERSGADAIGAMAPYFFKPQTAAELVAWFTPIANSNSLPFYYYNMPSMSGVSVSVPKFLALGGKAMPTLAGVKFTHNNLMEMSQCLMLDGCGQTATVLGEDRRGDYPPRRRSPRRQGHHAPRGRGLRFVPPAAGPLHRSRIRLPESRTGSHRLFQSHKITPKPCARSC